MRRSASSRAAPPGRNGSPGASWRGVFVLWAAATFVFFVQQLLPGSQATLILNQQTGNQQSYTAEQLAPTEAKYGLDQPVMTQYWDYIKGLSHGDLGKSYSQFKPVTEIISEQVGPTLVLTVTALILAWIISLATILFTSRRKKGDLRARLGLGDLQRRPAVLLARGDPAGRLLDRTGDLPGRRAGPRSRAWCCRR